MAWPGQMLLWTLVLGPAIAIAAAVGWPLSASRGRVALAALCGAIVTAAILSAAIFGTLVAFYDYDLVENVRPLRALLDLSATPLDWMIDQSEGDGVGAGILLPALWMYEIAPGLFLPMLGIEALRQRRRAMQQHEKRARPPLSS